MPGILDGKVAIVTGAGRGIGRAMTLGLLDAGARVAAVELDAPGARGNPGCRRRPRRRRTLFRHRRRRHLGRQRTENRCAPPPSASAASTF